MQYVLQVEQPGNSCQSINIDSVISGFYIYNCRSNANEYILQVGQLVNSFFFPS